MLASIVTTMCVCAAAGAARTAVSKTAFNDVLDMAGSYHADLDTD